MSVRKRFENDAVDKWGTIVMLVLLIVVIGPSVIEKVLEAPTTWHVTLIAIWVFMVAVYGHSVYRRKVSGRDVPTPPTVAPDAVPTSDVDDAVASTSTRVAAVKKLRELHPGLGLGDAVHLVDRSG
jgi:ribosomal protein L7/L12